MTIPLVSFYCLCNAIQLTTYTIHQSMCHLGMSIFSILPCVFTQLWLEDHLMHPISTQQLPSDLPSFNHLVPQH